MHRNEKTFCKTSGNNQEMLSVRALHVAVEALEWMFVHMHSMFNRAVMQYKTIGAFGIYFAAFSIPARCDCTANYHSGTVRLFFTVYSVTRSQ